MGFNSAFKGLDENDSSDFLKFSVGTEHSYVSSGRCVEMTSHLHKTDKAKNEWSFISTPPHVLVVLCLITQTVTYGFGSGC